MKALKQRAHAKNAALVLLKECSRQPNKEGGEHTHQTTHGIKVEQFEAL